MSSNYDHFEPQLPVSQPEIRTSTQAPEPVSKSGGDGMIGDEEMAVLEASSATKKITQAKETAKPKAETSKKLDTEQPAIKADDIKDAIKKLKVKRGDTEFELEEDALVPVKIMGKTEMVSMKDLHLNYSGKVGYDKKFNELSKERDTFYTEREQVQGRVNEFYRLAVDEKQPRLAIEYLAEAMGSDPKQIWDDLTAQIKAAAANTQDLNPDQLRAVEAEQETAHYRRKEELRRAETTKGKERESVINQVRSAQVNFGMSPEQFKGAYDDMMAEAARSGFDASTITPNMVGDYYRIIERRSQVTTFVNETFSGDERSEMIETQLYDVWAKNPDFTVEDIRDIAVAAFEAAPKKRGLIDRVKTQAKQTQPHKQTPQDWDDI